MPRQCQRCGEPLSFRNSFVWENQPVCPSCIIGLRQGQAWDEIPAAVPEKVSGKSVIGAILLALLFGPLGMAYVRRFLVSLAIGLPLLIGWIVLSGLAPDAPATYLVGFAYAVYEIFVMPAWAGIRASSLTREAVSN